MRPYVVSHLNAKATQLATGGDLLLREKSRNVHSIGRLLIKCNSFAESPNLVQHTGPYSASAATLTNRETHKFLSRFSP